MNKTTPPIVKLEALFMIEELDKKYKKEFLELQRFCNILVSKWKFKITWEDEIVSETLIKLHQEIIRWRVYDDNFKRLLFPILKNNLNNQYRKQSKLQFQDLTTLPDAWGLDHDNFASEEIYDTINRLWDKRHRDVILLKAEGYTYEDISKELGIPLGTAKSLLFKARNELSQIFLEAWNEDFIRLKIQR